MILGGLSPSPCGRHCSPTLPLFRPLPWEQGLQEKNLFGSVTRQPGLNVVTCGSATCLVHHREGENKQIEGSAGCLMLYRSVDCLRGEHSDAAGPETST